MKSGNSLEYDVLVIGTGASGMSAAVTAAMERNFVGEIIGL